MTAGQTIDYEALAQDAMRGIVRTVLLRAAKSGLPGDHHFYIAFDTQAPGVGLSRRLKEKYPEEMTIVLQHRFWDLAATDERFEVKLTFDGIPERLVVPYTAIRVFFDPSVRYTLQFEDPRAAASTEPETEGEDAPPRRRPTAISGVRQAERRPRVARKPKAVDKAAPGAAEGEDSPAEVTADTEQAEPPVAPAPAASSDEQPAAATGPQSGAQVFRLDQFRKK